MTRFIYVFLLTLCSGGVASLFAQQHPLLILKKQEINTIRKNVAQAPLFQQVVAKNQAIVDQEIKLGPQVPVPKDMAGGYTHERHKRNFFVLQKAGNLFQITGDEKYARYIREVLLAYAKLYPKLGLHPTKRSYATGKIFWQCLNDTNWLVYVSQAYDCIYDWLKPKDRHLLETQLFRPFADFISIKNPQFFNRIHNHSTWGNAAVGMIGLVMGDKELINRALYGLQLNKSDDAQKDDDNGLITLPNQKKAGFFAQLDHAFSPDGYYTEGPYYQRYAISPFILFAKALANNRPDLKIFRYRHDLLKKAVYALLYQTDRQGLFFPINDAQKGMSFKSRELISAVDIIYESQGKDASLLSIAEQQGKVTMDYSGFVVAQDIHQKKSQPFIRKSIELSDGKNGDEGALGILRSRKDDQEVCLVFKYTAQGLGHGHYDKLSYSLYGNQGEVIQDYGAARWVNIDQKQGGRYLPENRTWAKQTIAHNTVVMDETSHFKGHFSTGNAHHSDRYFYDASNPNFQIASAKDLHAYPGVKMHRTLALLKDKAFDKPILIDVFRVDALKAHQFDLPLWFQGHLLNTSFQYKAQTQQQSTLGTQAGYQHLWKEALGKSTTNQAQFSWFHRGEFFTATSWVSNNDELIFARLGANDPSFNLRRDPALIIRKKDQKQTVFATIIEPHGAYSPVDEVPQRPFGQVSKIVVSHQSDAYTAIEFSTGKSSRWTLIIVNNNHNLKAQHQLKIQNKTFRWQGVYHLFKH
ncbi:heparinase [marine bacterium AO1-C]|nr:heparinase [marine bacterium AO1-C]